MRFVKILFLFLWSFLPLIAVAQAPPSPTETSPPIENTPPPPPPTSMELQAQTSRPAPPVEDYGSAFFKMMSALVVLLLAIILVMWLFKSIARGKFRRHTSSCIEIIERRPLSQKSMLYLIEVDGARILLAESSLEVRPLYQEGTARTKGVVD